MGGAKNCPETPRQRMIGMMYLVLTAMLALNVSTDILNGFKLVDDSLHASLQATADRNSVMMANFQQAATENPEKNQVWFDLATEMVAKSDSLYDYIQNFKYEIAKLADGAEKADPAVRNVQGLSNLDVTGQYGLVEGNGAILREKMNEYRQYLIALAPKDSVEFNTLFSTPEGENSDGDAISWEESLFDGMPVGASITLLTKIQNDIRTAQGEIIQHLQISTDASDLRVNKMEALVIPESKYVIQGSKYSAKIVLAAIDTTQTPAYFVNGSQIGNDGVYAFTASGLGAHTYNGQIVVKGPDGANVAYPFTSDYSVGEPSATISNVDLNVMYRDFNNKFSISVPGVANEKVKVSVSGGTAQQSQGLWLIRPSEKANNVVITVSADLGDGKIQEMGKQTYRIKPKPVPDAYLTSGGKEREADNVTLNMLLSKDATITASYGPEGLLQLNWEVISFSLQTPVGIKNTKGNKFSAAQISDLQKLKKGTVILIRDIKAQDESGKAINLRSIAIPLN